jgi:ABC-type taurine transport system substrate-binding protein
MALITCAMTMLDIHKNLVNVSSPFQRFVEPAEYTSGDEIGEKQVIKNLALFTLTSGRSICSTLASCKRKRILETMEWHSDNRHIFSG